MDPHLTAFEPEARGNLVEGLEFHKFYFDNGKLSITFLACCLLKGHRHKEFALFGSILC